MNLESLNVHEEVSINGDLMLHIYPTKGMDYSVLSKKEKTVLDTMIKKFKNYKVQEIFDYIHKEKVYQKTNPGEIMPFLLVKEIRNF